MQIRYLWALPLLGATPAFADPISAPEKAMVEKAARSGDAAKTAAVVSVAKEMHPESAAEIDAIVASVNADLAAQHEQKLANAGFFDNWSGSGELGGSMATGNSDAVTAAAGLKLSKEGRHWRHAISALADLQRSDGDNTQERYAANYQVDRNLTDALYMVGTLGWERNAVAGLRSRFTESLGLGYKVIASPAITWRLEGGPAFRQAKFSDRTENGLAARLASDFAWAFAPKTSLSQTTSAYLEGGSSSILATTALTTNLSGSLSARFSFNVQYESDPSVGNKHTDTVSRATLVYGF